MSFVAASRLGMLDRGLGQSPNRASGGAHTTVASVAPATSAAHRKLIVALDFGTFGEALALARQVADLVGLFKINVQLFTAEGPDAVRKLADAWRRRIPRPEISRHSQHRRRRGVRSGSFTRRGTAEYSRHRWAGHDACGCRGTGRQQTSRAASKAAGRNHSDQHGPGGSAAGRHQRVASDQSGQPRATRKARRARRGGRFSAGGRARFAAPAGATSLTVIPGVRPAACRKHGPPAPGRSSAGGHARGSNSRRSGLPGGGPADYGRARSSRRRAGDR